MSETFDKLLVNDLLKSMKYLMTYIDFQHAIGINIIDPGFFSQSGFFFSY